MNAIDLGSGSTFLGWLEKSKQMSNRLFFCYWALLKDTTAQPKFYNSLRQLTEQIDACKSNVQVWRRAQVHRDTKVALLKSHRRETKEKRI